MHLFSVLKENSRASLNAVSEKTKQKNSQKKNNKILTQKKLESECYLVIAVPNSIALFTTDNTLEIEMLKVYFVNKTKYTLLQLDKYSTYCTEWQWKLMKKDWN